MLIGIRSAKMAGLVANLSKSIWLNMSSVAGLSDTLAASSADYPHKSRHAPPQHPSQSPGTPSPNKSNVAQYLQEAQA